MPCIVPGCANDGIHNLGVRCRRPDTSAIWAPNTEAFLCDEHAEQGMLVTVILEPNDTGQIHTRIISTDGHEVTRTTPILHQA